MFPHCGTKRRASRGRLDKGVREVDETKKEIAHLQKQVRDLRKALLIMQVGMIVFPIIWGQQYLQLIQKYREILRLSEECFESVKAVYSALQQFLLVL